MGKKTNNTNLISSPTDDAGEDENLLDKKLASKKSFREKILEIELGKNAKENIAKEEIKREKEISKKTEEKNTATIKAEESEVVERISQENMGPETKKDKVISPTPAPEKVENKIGEPGEKNSSEKVILPIAKEKRKRNFKKLFFGWEKKIIKKVEEDIQEVKEEVRGIKKSGNNSKDQLSDPNPPLAHQMEAANGAYEFPPDFLWGTANSAYQMEGGIINDWCIWEKGGKRMLKIMKSGQDTENFICGQACNSYELYENDFDLAKNLHNNAIRIGIEWARIEPKEGVWNIEAINHYRDVLRSAMERKLKIAVTLWHWTVPVWFSNLGGWEKKENIDYFLRFVELVIEELGGGVDYWVILNEPMMYVFGGYISRRHPPQKFSFLLAEKAIKNLVIAHEKSYDFIHKHFPNAIVGSTNMLNFFEPAHKWNILEVALSKFIDYYWNRRMVKKMIAKSDYLGMNYYFHDRIVFYPPFKKNLNKWTSDKGWEIYPKGIYHVLKYLSIFKKPILILENGLADAQDKDRASFIKEHLYWVQRAIQEGADVRGYFHWSLLDNFEWSWGWEPKFGLYAVDRKTFARTPRPSAAVYAEICKNNKLVIDK